MCRDDAHRVALFPRKKKLHDRKTQDAIQGKIKLKKPEQIFCDIFSRLIETEENSVKITTGRKS